MLIDVPSGPQCTVVLQQGECKGNVLGKLAEYFKTYIFKNRKHLFTYNNNNNIIVFEFKYKMHKKLK